MRFRDRIDAGKRLADRLKTFANQPNVIILALPRGGVPVAFEIAQALNLSLDVLNVRKLGVPGHEEMAMGAIAAGNVRIMNQDIVRSLNIPETAIQRVIEEEQVELARRERLYRDARPAPAVEGKTVLLVDDGLATGATMAAAVSAVKQQKPARIIVAVPTGSGAACAEFENMVSEVICLNKPDDFGAVGLWYEHFSQTTDQEVRQLLEQVQKHAEAR